jgi:hypothetical protein
MATLTKPASHGVNAVTFTPDGTMPTVGDQNGSVPADDREVALRTGLTARVSREFPSQPSRVTRSSRWNRRLGRQLGHGVVGHRSHSSVRRQAATSTPDCPIRSAGLRAVIRESSRH